MSNQATHREDARVSWPVGLEPGLSPVFSHNELEADVSVEAIWPWLLAAPRWRELYSNAWRVRLPGGARTLSDGMVFHWWTFGVPVETKIEVFEPHRQLAWSGRGVGSRGYHVWLLEPTATGCRIVTEETQSGAVVRLLAPVLRRGLLYFHQRWMEGLVGRAKSGPPPA